MDRGFPVGQPKTLVFDLNGKFLTDQTDQYRVRIATNLQAFWDRIRVGTTARDDTLRVADPDASAADPQWKGYPGFWWESIPAPWLASWAASGGCPRTFPRPRAVQPLAVGEQHFVRSPGLAGGFDP